jgi:hypothetical protein
MGEKANELQWGFACAIDDSFDIGVGDANDGVAAAVAATGAPKPQVLLPVLRRHWGLRLAVNYGNQKPGANFLATFGIIFYTIASWMVLPTLNKALRR